MVVWIIDAEQWPRALLRAELIERGYDAAGFVTIDDALAAPPDRLPDAIVLDSRGQELTPDRLAKLFDLRVPIILIGGAADLRQDIVRHFPWTAILQRPVSLGEIADRIAGVRT
jgi:DNA-binding response OmpR family regulator